MSENRLQLVRPSAMFCRQIMEYKAGFEARGEFIHGGAGLNSVNSCGEWLDFEGRGRRAYGKEYVPSSTFLAVRTHDSRLVGMIDVRHSLNAFLLSFGGHIGYSVRHTDRGRGYAGEMMRLILPFCRDELKLERVLLTCDRENAASRAVIEKSGGVLENEIAGRDPAGGKHVMRRYWITL